MRVCACAYDKNSFPAFELIPAELRLFFVALRMYLFSHDAYELTRVPNEIKAHTT